MACCLQRVRGKEAFLCACHSRPSLSLSLSPFLRPLWPEDRVVASRERYIAVDIYHSANHSTSIRPLRRAYICTRASPAGWLQGPRLDIRSLRDYSRQRRRRRWRRRRRRRRRRESFQFVDPSYPKPIDQLPELAITTSAIFSFAAPAAIKRSVEPIPSLPSHDDVVIASAPSIPEISVNRNPAQSLPFSEPMASARRD